MPVGKLALLTTLAALALPAAAQADYAHTVLAGESLTSIASADGLSLDALAAANGLTDRAELEIGQVLEIPPLDSYTSTHSMAQTSPDTRLVTAAGSRSYVVQPGDTLSAIAARTGTSVARLAALNGLTPTGLLLIGTMLTLPSGTAAVTSTGAATGSGNQPIAGDTTAGPYPTDARVSGSEIGAEASASGVDPAFAEAIGWQESGDDNDLVSSTGAVGVMQIEPATWAWINQVLTPGAPLDPFSAYDNIKGGVLLLHHLVSQTGSDAMAAAAYYQGLASVQANGLDPDTQQYVNDVTALTDRFGG